VRSSLIVFAALLIVPGTAIACERDSPTARLPGYSDEKAEERSNKLWSDWDVIGHYQRTRELMGEASAYYLGRVIKTESEASRARSVAFVEPLRALKGKMPVGTQTLEGFMPDSCGGPNGDGFGAYAVKEDLIIVFLGVSKLPNRPNGIGSVKVEDVRNLDLLDGVQTWLDSQPGYERWD